MIKIKDTFLKLTSRRYPNGTEDLAMDVVKELLPNIKFEQDEFGNYYLFILKENGEFSDTMFTSHLDTINSGPYTKSKTIWCTIQKKMIDNPLYKDNIVDDMSIKHVFDGDFIKTDGETNLGADDKAGVAIMMNLISENIPALYYFFVGEESGCIGSSSLAEVWGKGNFPTINRCISFDRRGYDSVITSQGGICASNEFATELSKRLNEYGFWFKPDPTGVYTDSAEFTSVIPECTNLSVGYFSEHTKTERQDIEFLEFLAATLIVIDWDTLPTVREKTKEYNGKKSTRKYGGYGGYNGYTGGHSAYGDYDNWYEDDKWVSSYPKQSFKKDDSFETKPPKSRKFIDDGNGNLTETNIDELEFDTWYEKQKSKEWVFV